jgi:hypothetical protein
VKFEDALMVPTLIAAAVGFESVTAWVELNVPTCSEPKERPVGNSDGAVKLLWKIAKGDSEGELPHMT